MIKVIVISDIKIYCEGLSLVLSNSYPIKMVGAEHDFESALIRIKHASPDVILLDMTMPDSSGVAQQVMDVCPDAKIVALAVPEDESKIIKCAKAGIAGYVAREASLEELVETVIGARKGEFFCPPKIAACIFRKFHNISRCSKTAFPSAVLADDEFLFDGLTKREQQIVALMADGLSNKQISRSLTIEVSTVKNHVHNILVKLDVKSRTQAVSLLQRRQSSNLTSSLDLDPGLEISH